MRKEYVEKFVKTNILNSVKEHTLMSKKSSLESISSGHKAKYSIDNFKNLINNSSDPLNSSRDFFNKLYKPNEVFFYDKIADLANFQNMCKESIHQINLHDNNDQDKEMDLLIESTTDNPRA